jgi:hypothetical protein
MPPTFKDFRMCLLKTAYDASVANAHNYLELCLPHWSLIVYDCSSHAHQIDAAYPQVIIEDRIRV